MTSPEFAVEKNVPNTSTASTARASTRGPIPDDAENGESAPGQKLSDQDVQNVLDQLDHVEVDDDDDDEESYDNYSRTLSHRFPKECRELFGLAGFDISVRDVLTLFMQAQPDNQEMLQCIRDEFYSGDKSEDHLWSLEKSWNWTPSPKRRAEIRVAREKDDEKRRRNCEFYGADNAGFEVVWRNDKPSVETVPDYLTLEHPFVAEQKTYEKETDRMLAERQSLDWDWGTLVRMALQASKTGGSDVEFEPVSDFESKLNAREDAYEEDWQSLCECRWTLIDKIRDWHLASLH